MLERGVVLSNLSGGAWELIVNNTLQRYYGKYL